MSGAYSIEVGEVTEVLSGFQDNAFDALLCDPPYGFRFMGKRWDYDVPSVATWGECLRVLKPGAPLLAFGGARTYHRLAVNIEDAGFELRDCLMWLYGKGFPKSQNIHLAITKADDSVLKAIAWDGYGTALKPAHEPIVLARKPLEGTMVQNVARWGVGGLAIDASRIGRIEGDRTEYGRDTDIPATPTNAYGVRKLSTAYVPAPEGRWPANLLFDEAAATLLDAEAGDRPSTPYRENTAMGAVLPLAKRTAGGYADGGGPSRFFYCAKVSTREREAGCEALPQRSAGEVTDREEDSAGLESPRAGAGRGGGARNHHPTLKPLSLTTWLARLIMPPSPGALLVPFAGAGSEMIGALKAGWGAVLGIECEAEYAEIARARLRHWAPESEAA